MKGFQSSPVPEDGRYFRIAQYGVALHAVSILARPGGRALPPSHTFSATRSEFQSSPVPEDGRYSASMFLAAPRLLCFNPRPSRRTGATTIAQIMADGFIVSILARPGGRALRTISGHIGYRYLFQSSPVPEDGRYAIILKKCPFLFRFNPRPSRRTGATRGQRRGTVQGLLFQSSPVPEDGRYSPAVCALNGLQPFQSSPVPEDGRYTRPTCEVVRPIVGFNPRPSRRTGATITKIKCRDFVGSFQSSPVPEDGRYKALRRVKSWKPGFNPRPSRRTGAT